MGNITTQARTSVKIHVDRYTRLAGRVGRRRYQRFLSTMHAEGLQQIRG
jgi:hypothetical protein